MEDENTYQKGIVADINLNKTTKPMESWSILSDHVKYVQHDKSDILHNVNFDSLITPVNEDIYKELKRQDAENNHRFQWCVREIKDRLFRCV